MGKKPRTLDLAFSEVHVQCFFSPPMAAVRQLFSSSFCTLSRMRGRCCSLSAPSSAAAQQSPPWVMVELLMERKEVQFSQSAKANITEGGALSHVGSAPVGLAAYFWPFAGIFLVLHVTHTHTHFPSFTHRSSYTVSENISLCCVHYSPCTALIS